MVVEYLEKHGRDSLVGVLCHQIATISKQKNEAILKDAAMGINTEQAWILIKAYENLDEGGVHQSELVTEENLIGAKSQVSRLTHDLVEKGYLVRHADVNDRRQTYLQITEEGKEVYHKIQDIILTRKSAYLHTLTIEEYNLLLKLLGKALVGVKNY